MIVPLTHPVICQAGPSLLWMKGKTPSEGKQWSLWRHALRIKRWKGQRCTSYWFLWLQPHIVHWYTIINVVCSLCDKIKSKRIYEGVYFFTAMKTGLLLLSFSVVSVLTLGWTHGTNTVVQRSLALIPALVRRHSCFSSPAATLVNLQQNSLPLQSEI